MASLLDVIRSINEKGLRQTVIDSRNAPGGFLDRGRFHRPSSGALVGDSNIYDFTTDSPVGNTVTNYTRGIQSPTLALDSTRPGKLYTNYRLGTQPQQPQQTLDQAADSVGGSGGGTGSALLDAFLELFEGQYYTDPSAYFNAVLQSFDTEAEKAKTRGREDYGRNKSSLLEQVSRLFEDLDTEERRGQANIAGYYNSLGDIYQSSQGVREQEFTGEVGKERTRIGKQRDEGVASLDRALNDYLEGIDRTKQENVGKTFGSALDIRNQFAPTPQFAASVPGSVNVQDTSALLRNLNSFLEPTNVRNRYRGTQQNGANPIYSYLSPLG